MVHCFPLTGGMCYGTVSSRYEPGQIFIQWMKIPAIGHDDRGSPPVARQMIAQQSPRGEQYSIVTRARGRFRRAGTVFPTIGGPRRFARTGGTHRLDLKAFGERISARDPDRKTAKIQFSVALMNRFSAPGTAEIIRLARSHRGKATSRLRRQFCNNADANLKIISQNICLPSNQPRQRGRFAGFSAVLNGVPRQVYEFLTIQ